MAQAFDTNQLDPNAPKGLFHIKARKNRDGRIVEGLTRTNGFADLVAVTTADGETDWVSTLDEILEFRPATF